MAPNMDAGEDVTVTGDGWKPRKQTILGALADGYLMSKGKQPMFSLMRDRRSFNEAMQGYQQDPKQSINRVLKIPGMEDEALKMLNQQTDNDRAATVAQLQKAKFEEGIRDRVAALMGAAKPDTWGSVAPIAKRVLERYGMDTSEIPENYDEAAIQAFRYGAVPVDKQMDNARADEALDERVRLAEEAEEGRNSRTVYSQEQQTNRTILGQDRQDARNVYNNNRADQRKLITPPKGMAAAGQGRGITGSGKFLEKDGQRVGELTPDGKYMMLYSGDKVRLYDAKTRKFSHEAEIPNK